MLAIKADCLGRAHETVVKRILEHGHRVVTQDHEVTLEVLDAVIEVRTPMTEPMVSPYCNFQGQKLREYVDGLLNGVKGTFTYDYHGRIFCWGDNLGFGVGLGIDQISNIVDYLKTEGNWDSRRAVCITWYPHSDLSHSGPCLQYIQFIIRDNKLNMSVLFRSNDMLSALGANMYALVHLQKYVALLLQIEVGGYCHHSVSAHIYPERDQYEMENMLPALTPLIHTTHEHKVQVLKTLRPDIMWKV